MCWRIWFYVSITWFTICLDDCRIFGSVPFCKSRRGLGFNVCDQQILWEKLGRCDHLSVGINDVCAPVWNVVATPTCDIGGNNCHAVFYCFCDMFVSRYGYESGVCVMRFETVVCWDEKQVRTFGCNDASRFDIVWGVLGQLWRRREMSKDRSWFTRIVFVS